MSTHDTGLWALALTLCLLISLVWSALVLGASAGIARLLPAARDRHWLWWAALVVCVLAFAGSTAVLLPYPGFTGEPGENLVTLFPLDGGTVAESEATLWTWLYDVSIPLALLYGAGVLWQVARLIRGRQRLAGILAHCEPLQDPGLLTATETWREYLGVRVTPRLLKTSLELSPFLSGLRRPVIVLPAALLRHGKRESAALICAHELAHLRRGDIRLVPIQRVLSILLWFNPFVREIVRRLNASREAACDALVLNHAADARRDYARALLEVLRLAAGNAGRPAAPGIPLVRPGRKEHEMRLKDILHSAPARRAPLRTLLCCGFLLSALVPAAAVQADIADQAVRSAAAGLQGGEGSAAGDAAACKKEDLRPVRRVPPAYPVPGEEASVVLEFTVAPDGSTQDIRTVKTTDARFNKAAMDALSQWRYAPCDGAPREGVRVRINFSLEG